MSDFTFILADLFMVCNLSDSWSIIFHSFTPTGGANEAVIRMLISIGKWVTEAFYNAESLIYFTDRKMFLRSSRQWKNAKKYYQGLGIVFTRLWVLHFDSLWVASEWIVSQILVLSSFEKQQMTYLRCDRHFSILKEDCWRFISQHGQGWTSWDCHGVARSCDEGRILHKA